MRTLKDRELYGEDFPSIQGDTNGSGSDWSSDLINWVFDNDDNIERRDTGRYEV